MKCYKKFSLVTRRNFCEICNGQFCNKCSTESKEGEKKQCLCKDCYENTKVLQKRNVEMRDIIEAQQRSESDIMLPSDVPEPTLKHVCSNIFSTNDEKEQA